MLKHHIIESSQSSDCEVFDLWRIYISDGPEDYSTYGIYFSGDDKDEEESINAIIYKIKDEQIEPYSLIETGNIGIDCPEALLQLTEKAENLLVEEYPGKQLTGFKEKFSIEI